VWSPPAPFASSSKRSSRAISNTSPGRRKLRHRQRQLQGHLGYP
jgi:hypothetical protein